jgi:hypothetical protein
MTSTEIFLPVIDMSRILDTSSHSTVSHNLNEQIDSVLGEVKAAFARGLRGPASQASKFVTRYDINAIWHERDRFHRLIFQLQNRYKWCIPRVATTLKAKYVKIISILATIKWNKWEMFDAIFLNQRDRDDDALPFQDGNLLAHDSFLGDDGFDFFNYQWVFLPIVVPFRQKRVCEAEERLPFLYDPRPINKGAHGSVTREYIPPGYFVVDRDGTTNQSVSSILLNVVFTMEKRQYISNFEDMA